MQNELTLPCRIETNPRRRIRVIGCRRRKPSGPSRIEQAVNILSGLISSGCCLAMIYLVARLL